jgi:hypothetical protein
MAIEPDKLAAAMTLIRGMPQLKPFLDWLHEKQDRDMGQLVSANDEIVLRLAQGAVRKGKEILDAIERGRG